MALAQIGPAGSLGVIKDLSSKLLKPAAWTDALNVRFLDGLAYQFLGQGEVYPGAAVIPFHVMPVTIAGARYWVYAGLNKVYAVSGATGSTVHTNITRQTASADVDYAATPNSWTSTMIGGIPILNPGNKVDPPQQWDMNLTHKLAALSAFPASTYCKSLRSFKNQLVALNVTDGGTDYPFMVWWSSLADPGSVPASWVYNDPAVDGGRFDLAEGQDAIVDGLGLRDSLMIYRESSVYRLDYVGGAFINQSNKVLGTSGAMNRNCIVELDGFHLLLTNQDVVTHDGLTASSALDKQTRRTLFRSIDSQNFDRSFVVKNPFMNEVMICYPQAGSVNPDMALVYNYVDRTTSFREIPNLNHANFGPVEVGSSQPWDSDDSPWSSDSTLWNAAEYTPDAARVLMASNDQQLLLLDSSTSFDGELPAAFVERRGLTFAPPGYRSLAKTIQPHITGQVGATVMVQIGAADDAYADPAYADAQPFTIGTSVELTFDVEGRYIAIRFATGTAYEWRLDSYDVNWSVGSRW